jgi:hypothetical protein
MRQYKWPAIAAAGILASGFVTALVGGVANNWFGVACGAVLVLVGVGMAVLALQHEG